MLITLSCVNSTVCQLRCGISSKGRQSIGPFDLSSKLGNQFKTLAYCLLILFSNQVHLIFELPKILVVAIGLIVVLIDTYDVVLLALCLFNLYLIDSLFVLVYLVR